MPTAAKVFTFVAYATAYIPMAAIYGIVMFLICTNLKTFNTSFYILIIALSINDLVGFIMMLVADATYTGILMEARGIYAQLIWVLQVAVSYYGKSIQLVIGLFRFKAVFKPMAQVCEYVRYPNLHVVSGEQ